jgi:hypothetical protein
MMIPTNRPYGSVTRIAFALAAVIGCLTGCALQEAVIDGAYGGISDTIATIISDSLLAVARGEG